MKPAIRVENLSKRYRIGTRTHPANRNLTEALVAGARGLWRGLMGEQAAVEGDGTFWALKDVSFEVRPGEVVGIIGRNGAGKSTLLKVLSRIVEPTGGRCEVRGRMGSLLEVGTGFHPELTGRENVYLNGSVLGMSRREITRKFDEIVAFSEIEKFIDTPVKRYSSGMYVRLAFAVAAHLEPEILVVDEVLAVGDATFQRRCLQRLGELARLGLTVLLVSHNMDLIPRLCDKAVLLKAGTVDCVGPAAVVTDHYLAEQLHDTSSGDLSQKARSGCGHARFTSLQLIGPDGSPLTSHRSGEDLVLRMQVTSEREFADVALAVIVQSWGGVRICTTWTREANWTASLVAGHQTFECRISSLRLRPGQRVVIGLWMAAAEQSLDWVEDALIVEVADGPDTRAFSTDSMQGIVLFDFRWSRLPCETAGGHL